MEFFVILGVTTKAFTVTSWHLELPNKKIRRFNRKKFKGTKGVRKEIHSINGTIIQKDFIIAL